MQGVDIQMKILLYIDGIGGGGAERAMANLANGLIEKGEKVILVTSFPTQNEYALSSQIKRYNLEKFQPKNRMFIRKNLGRIQKLRRICQKEKCDIAVSFMEGPNFRLVFSTLFLPVKTIISLRSDPKIEYSNFVHRLIANFVYSLSNACVFQTEEAKNFWGKCVRKKGIIILNSVASEFYLDEEIEYRSNIVSVGRLEKTKNFELLINAFSKIAEDYPKEQLIIYGEGGYRNQLEQQIIKLKLSDRIQLPGRIGNVSEKIRDAKIFVLSSDYEGMPNSLMEAMALGIPAIATDCPCGGPDTLLEHGACGILIPVNGIHELEKEMRRLLDNRKEIDKYSKMERKKAEKFKIEIICSEWELLFKQLMNNSSNSLIKRGCRYENWFFSLFTGRWRS